MSIPKSVFELNLSVMKNVLTLMEFKFGGRDSEQYKYIKEQIMNYTYEGLKKFYVQGLNAGMFDHCECNANLRRGHRDCPSCGGCGYKDKEK